MATTLLEQRKIEAKIIGLVYERLKSEFGAEKAGDILRDTIKSAAVAHGRALAAEQDGPTSMQTFIDIQHVWTAGGALEVDVDVEDGERFEFRVTRCRYADAYKEMGLAEIGGILSCDRDGTMCEGYDSNLKLTRTQTIMEGASHCDFKFRYERDN